MSQVAFLFPGQGSHGDDVRPLATEYAGDLLALARERLGIDPLAHVAHRTDAAQAAIYCATIGALRQVRRFATPDAVAGHSLGEIAALVAAGCLSETEGTELVVERGRLMHQASARCPGTMLVLLGRLTADIRDVVRACGAYVANDNAPNQLVASGTSAALSDLQAAARHLGLAVTWLDVAGAFHSPAMAAAVKPFRARLDDVEIRRTHVAAYSAVTAEPFNHVPAQLAEGLVVPVLWRQTLRALDRIGVGTFVEVGPGRVLTGLAKRTVPNARAVPLKRLMAGQEQATR